MKAIDAVRRSAVAVEPERTVGEAAAVMDVAGVGALGVVDAENHLIGLVTDRDLVCRAMAAGMSYSSRIDSVMTTPVVTVEANSELDEAYALFRTHALRRLPVVEEGRFIGMLTVDDLLIDLAAGLADVVRPITGEVIFGHHDAKVPASRS